MNETIHIAHSVTRKHGGSFHVRAYVLRDTFKHTMAIANADTLAEAQETVLKRIADDYRRDSLVFPAATINHGKMSAIVVDHWLF